MAKSSFLDKITGKVSSEARITQESDAEIQPNDSCEVDHLWMKEDLDAKKPKLEKNPKIDTAILRNRIADKIAKMNDH
jgi:hypothetical protein